MARGLGFSISAAISVVAWASWWFVACARSRARASRSLGSRPAGARSADMAWDMGWSADPRRAESGRRAYGRMPSMACAGADCAAPTAPTGGARPTARAGAAGAAAALGDVLVRSRMSKNQHNRFTRLGPSLLSRDP